MINALFNFILVMLCFDIETTGLDPKRCNVTVVCTEDFVSGVCATYEFARYPQRRQELVDEMVRCFEASESLCAFNGIRFDIPFMVKALGLAQEYQLKWIAKTSDILEQSRIRFKQTFGLNLLCETNQIPIKISDGKEAIRMAEAGRWDELNEYCARDVSILCDIYRKQFITHPRNRQTINLEEWSRSKLYDENPCFFHYCRDTLLWPTAMCANLKDRFRSIAHIEDTLERVAALQDNVFCPETMQYVRKDNAVSMAYHGYNEMSSFQDLESESDIESKVE